MSAARAERAKRDWLPPAAIALALALVAYYAAASGTWLDEYWQIYVSGAPRGELVGRLLADAHPPWFNLFARPLVGLVGSNVVAARLISLAGAVALLGVGLLRLTALERGVRWRIFLLAAASAGPVELTGLGASFRVYPWLFALAVLQSAALLLVANRRSVSVVAITVITAAGIALHYVHAAGAIAIALVTAFAAFRHGERRIVAAIALGIAIGCGLDLITGLIQLPHWRANLDTDWIALRGTSGLAVLIAAQLKFILFNLVSTGLLAMGLLRSRGRAPWLWLLAPLPIAVAAWLAMDLVTPLLVERYLSAVTALLVVAAAAAWQALPLKRPTQVAIALLAALQPLSFILVLPPQPRWEAGAEAAARLVRACPASPVYAVSAWAFRDRSDSRTAAFEQPVFRLAYERVGARFGLQPRFVDRPLTLLPGACPSIIWAEAAHGLAKASPAAVLRRARISAPPGSTERFVATPNGALLIVRPLPNLQQSALQGAHGRP